MRDDTEDFEAMLRAAIDGKTKPLGALGRIEELAAQIARLQRSLAPRMETCSLTHLRRRPRDRRRGRLGLSPGRHPRDGA